MIYCVQKTFLKEHLCALKFSYLRSSRGLGVSAQAHSLKGTLIDW